MKDQNGSGADVLTCRLGDVSATLTISVSAAEWIAIQAAAKREGVPLESYVSETLQEHGMELRNRHGSSEPAAVMISPTRNGVVHAG
jgi:hypothetical protein